MVRALASHQCGPGSTPGLGVICGLSLLLVLVLAGPRGFFSGYSGFRPFSKTNISKFQFDLDYCQALYHEPLAQEIEQALPVLLTLINKLLLVIIYLERALCWSGQNQRSGVNLQSGSPLAARLLTLNTIDIIYILAYHQSPSDGIS